MAGIYAEPREVKIEECYFYHTMELPGHGLVKGPWDLRRGIREYVGGLDFAGKRVIDVGAASGFVSFWLESEGANVTAYDISEEQDWDIVPFARGDHQAEAAGRRQHIRALNNSFWFAHRAIGSEARVAYGTVYELPVAIGPVDITVFGSVLLHIRDPFLALQRAAAVTTEAIIVTDRSQPSRRVQPVNLARGPVMRFLPNFKTRRPADTWWWLPAETIVRFLGVLGFEKTTVSRHSQDSQWGKQRLFTVVGRR